MPVQGNAEIRRQERDHDKHKNGQVVARKKAKGCFGSPSDPPVPPVPVATSGTRDKVSGKSRKIHRAIGRTVRR